jgi:hypothetical protein
MLIRTAGGVNFTPPALSFVMKICTLLATLLWLPSCSFGPVATTKGVSLGGSLFVKTKGHYATYDGPFGKLSYGTTENDETVVPSKVSNYYGIKAAADAASSMLKTTESTKRVLGSQGVATESIKSSERVESLRILNPVESATP